RTLLDAQLDFTKPTTTSIYPLSLHDALPIWQRGRKAPSTCSSTATTGATTGITRSWRERRPPSGHSLRFTPATWWRTRARNRCRSEEHTSELQSPYDLVCRLLLEKKNNHNEK